MLEYELILTFAKENPSLAFYAFMAVYTVKFWKAQRVHNSNVGTIVSEVITLNNKIDKVIGETERQLNHLQQNVDKISGEVQDVKKQIVSMDADICEKIETLDNEVERIRKVQAIK